MPLTRAVPKEMLPLGTKPILQHIVDELRSAGLREIFIVSSAGKAAITEHFASMEGVTVFAKAEALGPGHSVLCAREFIENEDFLVAFGDAPFSGNPGEAFLPKMLHMHESEKAGAVLAVDLVPAAEVHLRAVVTTSEAPVRGVPTGVTGIVQKPSHIETSSAWAVTGRYTFGPEVFDALDLVASRASGEILLADAIHHMLSEGRSVFALPLDEGLRRFDTGHLDGYVEAFRAFTS
jgi:UTP--glucose-1-phosphate uridylyltransferase